MNLSATEPDMSDGGREMFFGQNDPDLSPLGHELGISASAFFRLAVRIHSPADRKMASGSTLCQTKKFRAQIPSL